MIDSDGSQEVIQDQYFVHCSILGTFEAPVKLGT
jgi:hypothetical protein